MIECFLGKIIGKTDGKNWGQVHDFVPDEEIKRLKRGRLVAAIGLSKPEDISEVEMVSLGREILARLHEEYYGEISMGILGKLKTAVTKVAAEFEGIELTAVVLTGTAIYVAANAGKIWIKNENAEGFLVEGNFKGDIKSFSGWGTNNEMMVIGNNIFWKNIPLGIIKAAVEKGEEEGEEMLTAEVHGAEGGGGEAGVIIRIQENKIVEAKEYVAEPVVVKESWKDKFEKMIPKRNGPVFVNYEDKGKKQKRTVWVGLALLVVLAGLAVAGRIKTQQNSEKASVVNSQIESLMDKYNEAQSLIGLNVPRIRVLTAEIRAELPNIDNKKKDPRVQQITDGLPELEAQVSGKKKNTVNRLIDVSMLRSGSTADQVAAGDGRLWVLDRSGNRVISVDPGKGSGDVVAGEDKLGKVKLLAAYPSKIEIWSDKGIIECKIANNQCTTKVKSDSEWKNIAGMAMFAGNAYLLDPGANQIWRYAVTDSGFGTKVKWVGKDEKVDFSSASSITIDGDIWVIGAGGKITKLNRGVVQDFAMGDLDKPIGNNPLIYADENTNNLYILDKDNSRIVAIKKSGEYAFQVDAAEAGQASGFTIDEVNKTIYLSGSNLVWKVIWQE